MNKVEELMDIIRNSDDIVFFGGAGVSTPSGIPDFRGSKGLYNFFPEEILSHSFFISHPKEFYDFYWNNLVFVDARPNACHYFLSFLEKEGKLKGIITQNVDRLHQMAGSKNVIELHGNVYEYTCTKCGKHYSLESLNMVGIPYCKECHGIIKPNVVLYQELLNEENLDRSIELIRNCEILIVGGTSLSVFPAAGLVKYFNGKVMVIINNESYPNKIYINQLDINDDISVVMNKNNY